MFTLASAPSKPLTVYITIFPLVFRPKTVASKRIVMIYTFRALEAEILRSHTFIHTAFLHVFVFRRDQRRDRQ